MNLREEFEKTETYQFGKFWMIDFDFDEEKQVYYSSDPRFMSSTIAINAACTMFQELKRLN